jgi:DNA polymerase II small subunit/DNA polymerase delta subunit B
MLPIAPEIVETFPYQDCDPFVIQERPDFLVYANNKEFLVYSERDTTVCSLPSYATSGCFVCLSTIEGTAKRVQVRMNA